MSDLIATEAADPRYEDLADWPCASALHALWEAQAAAVASVRGALPAIEHAAEAALPRLRAGGRLIYCGAGTSGRIGAQDGAELAPTFGWAADRTVLLIAGGAEALIRSVEGAEDDVGRAHADIARHGVGPDDVAIATAASGRTPYTLACAIAARAAGALTIGIANTCHGAPLLRAVEHPVLIETGAEPIAGSTRLKAGTAQKVALNLLSTLLMLRMGRVWRGRMVQVVAGNAKLRARAEAMVMTLGGCDAAAAAAALAEAGGNVAAALRVLEEKKARGFAPGPHQRPRI